MYFLTIFKFKIFIFFIQFVKSQDQFEFDFYNNSLEENFTSRKLLRRTCLPNPNCNRRSKYRTLDGKCNNLWFPNVGTAGFRYRRELSPEYSQPNDLPRGGFFPGSLPNARLISQRIHNEVYLPDLRYSQMLMSFGQFASHDIIFTQNTQPNPSCCQDPQNLNAPGVCNVVKAPENDSFLQAGTCIPGARERQFCPESGGQREQINRHTSFLDLSLVYGVSVNESNNLREKFTFSGRLRTGLDNLLPFSDDTTRNLFLAGDARVNQNLGLAALHTIWVREHNRIANELRSFGGKFNFNDELIFQEARRLTIAEYQNIVYNEFLRVLLTPIYYRNFQFDINSLYRNILDPTMDINMPGGVFRMGHSMIASNLSIARNRAIIGNYQLRDVINFAPNFITDSQSLSNILEGLFYTPNQQVDPFVSRDVTDFFPGFTDLITRNIMKGRDFGIPNYNIVRKYCKLPSLNFGLSASENYMREETFELLKQIYQGRENDIDLFTGGLSEITVSGGILGPTFSCIITNQFVRLKFGDRFFFSHLFQSGSFNLRQIRHLRQRRLSDVICDNTNIHFIPPNVLFSSNNPASINAPILCTQKRRLRTELFI